MKNDDLIIEKIILDDPRGVVEIVMTDSTLADLENYLGVTPLVFAVKEDAVKCIEALLALGVNPNRKLNIRSPVSGRIDIGVTPLMFARSKRAVELLLQFNANPHEVDGRGRTCRQRMLIDEHKEAVIALDADDQDIHGRPRDSKR